MLGNPYSINLKYVDYKDNNLIKIISGEINIDNSGYFRGVFIKGTKALTIHKVHGTLIDMTDMITIMAFEYPTKKDGSNIVYIGNKIIPEECKVIQLEGKYSGEKFIDIILQNIKTKKTMKAEDISIETLLDTFIGFQSEGFKTELNLQKSYFN